MLNELRIEGIIEPPPRVQRVVALEDVLAGIVEPPVSQQETPGPLARGSC